MKVVETRPGKTYAVECVGEVVVTNTETGVVVAQGDGSGQVLFTACGSSYTVSDDAAKVAELFKLAPRLKLALLQGGAGGWLPKGFTELEYLESPATPNAYVESYFWLPLPRICSKYDSILYETEHMFTDYGTALQGEGIVGNFITFFIGNNNSQSGKYVAIDGILYGNNYFGNRNEKFTCSNGEWHTIRHYLGNNTNPKWQLSVDGELKVNVTDLQFNPEEHYKTYFCVFGTNGGHAMGGRKRTAKIWVNGTLIYDLVPVLRNSDGIPGFWDNVSKQFFENVGAGSFGYRIKTSGGSAGYSLRDPYYTAPQRPEPTVKARRTDVGVEIVPAEQPVEGEEWVYFSSTQDAELYFREETDELLTE